jgi:hypothetical protein
VADELTEMHCCRSKDFANGSVREFFQQSMERQVVRLGVTELPIPYCSSPKKFSAPPPDPRTFESKSHLQLAPSRGQEHPGALRPSGDTQDFTGHCGC